jgi:type I restriction enzyme R subunit
VSLDKANGFETDLYQHMASHGWLAADFDQQRAIFPRDACDWLQAAQPQSMAR